MGTVSIVGSMGRRQLAVVTVFLALVTIGAGARAGSNDPGTEPLPVGRDRTASDQPVLTPQIGPSVVVVGAAFSPNGQQILTASKDKTARLWDAASGRLLRTLTGHAHSVTSASFSPDGRQVVTACYDGTARVWDAATGNVVRTLTGHKTAAWSTAFSPDGRWIVTASEDKTAKLWDAGTGRAIRTFVGHGGSVSFVSFSPSGQQIVTGSEDKTAKVWDAATGRLLRTLAGHAGAVSSASFSPDGQQIVTASKDKTVRVWDAATGSVVRIIVGHSDVVNSAVFSPNGQQIVSASFDGAAKLWDAATGNLEHTLIGHSGAVWCAAFSPSGQEIVTASSDTTAKMWSAASGRLLRTLAGQSVIVTDTSFSPNGQQIVAGSYDKTATVWDASTGRLQRKLVGHRQTVWYATFSPDNQQILTASSDNTAKFWDAATGRYLRTLAGYDGRLQCVSLSSNGKQIVTGDGGKDVKVWDAATGQFVRALTLRGSAVVDASFSPSGKQIVTSNGNKTLSVWDAITGRLIRTFAGHSDSITAVIFSPDGHQILTASDDGTAKLWDANTGRVLRTLAGHNAAVYCASFSPNGRQVVTGSDDHTVKVWETATGRLLRTLVGHRAGVLSASFSPNGKRIVTGSYDNTTKIWDASTGQELVTLISFTDGTWAVTDPEGRYDGSNGGDVEGLHWVVGNEPIALSQLRDRYYEPGLLAKVMGFDKTSLRDVQAFDHVKLYPEVTTAVDSSSAPNRVAVHLAERGGGIGRVQVYVNDVLFQDDARPVGADSSGKTLDFTVDLSLAPTLRPGGLAANDVRVVAYNGENWLPSRPIALSRGADLLTAPPTSGNAAPPSVPAKRRLFAVVAGTSDYAAPALQLKFPARDATSFAEALRVGAEDDPLIERPDIALLAAGPGTPAGTLAPTKANLAAAFARIAAQKPAPDDILVVYLAGHGIAIPLNDSTYCYLAQNANSADTATLASDSALRSATTVTSAELADWMGKIGATYRVVILDTCAAGAAGRVFMDKRAVSGDQIRAMKRFQATEGCHVLMGCAADKVSYEASQYGQGLLTYALLQGMKGPALRENSWIDVRSLFGYVEETVPKLAGDIGGIQQPAYQKPDAGSFDIGKLTENDRGKIKLTTARPQILRVVMGNKADGFDDLDLATLVRARFSDTDAYAARGGESAGAAIPPAAPATFVYVDADHLTGAIQPVCQYIESGDKVTITITLIRDRKRIGSTTVTGSKATDATREALAAKVTDAVERAVEK